MRETTDWTRYYEKPFITAHVTRRITGRLIAKMVLATGDFSEPGGSIIELGGGNSSFCDTLVDRLHARHYTVVDSNPRGTGLFLKKHPRPDEYTAVRADIFALDPASVDPADLVFSAGLVEHFPPEKTEDAIRRHFELARPGGLVLITFPVATPCYRLIRSAAEKLGLWRFPDERPLPLDGTAEICGKYGEVLAKRLNRAILLTQGVVLARKQIWTEPNQAHSHSKT